MILKSALLILSVTFAHNAGASVERAPAATCAQLCGQAKASLKARAKSVEEHQKLWERRFGVTSEKNEVIRYDRGYSAAESLLESMQAYETKSKRDEPLTVAMTIVMARCFPEAYVSPVEARLSALSKTLWVSRNTKIAEQILSCE